jgi:hypothetical protein
MRKPTRVEAVLGQHINLNVAAHLARTQLVPDRGARYDSQHLLEIVDAIARALMRVAPVYCAGADGQPRELTAVELQAANFSDGALQLADGRRLASVTMKRGDVRQAIAILRSIGIAEVGAPATAMPPVPLPAVSRIDLRAQLAELETLLAPPLLPQQVEQARRIAVRIARHAKHGQVANLAMQLMSALQGGGDGCADLPGGYRLVLARLRAALEDAQANN